MRERILKIYKFRCVSCRKSTREVHEITPKSLTRDWKTLDNMVPLCTLCHREVHQTGAINHKNRLNVNRERILQSYYGTIDMVRIDEQIRKRNN